MFDEIPEKDVDTPAGTPQVRNYQQMLLMLNRIIQRAPEFNKTGLVGTPINAIFDYPMATKAGYVFFNNPNFPNGLAFFSSGFVSFAGIYIRKIASQSA